MTGVWLIVLVIYGLATQWNIPTLFWLLLIPMAIQDVWDKHHKIQ